MRRIEADGQALTEARQWPDVWILRGGETEQGPLQAGQRRDVEPPVEWGWLLVSAAPTKRW